MTKNPFIFHVDRSQPFDPAVFGCKNLTFWKGNQFGDGLDGEPEHKIPYTLDPERIDFSRYFWYLYQTREGVMYRFVGEGSLLPKGLSYQVQLARLLIADVLRPDAQLGMALFSEPDQLTLRLLNHAYGLTHFLCTGTAFRFQCGTRMYLLLFCNEGNPDNWSMDLVQELKPTTVSRVELLRHRRARHTRRISRFVEAGSGSSAEG